MSTVSEKVVDTIHTAGQLVVDVVNGLFVERRIYITAYLDGFAVNSSDLTPEQVQTLDSWIAGDASSSFAFRPGRSDQRIVLIAGLASQTGPEERNIQLGEERAASVYGYLIAGLGTDQVDQNVRSLGSSDPRPGFDQPGEEHAENRAVAVVMEQRSSLIGAPPPPPPPQDPPPPKSREWELSVTAVFSVGDPIPIVDAVGAQRIEGTLRNVRTGEERVFRIDAGGLNFGISLLPADVGVNAEIAEYAPFPTHWSDFDDFNFSLVNIVGAGVAAGAEVSAGSIQFLALGTRVEPNTLIIKTNLAASAQLQWGLFYFPGY